MASKPLLAKKSGIKGWFFFSFSRIVTGLKTLHWPISSIKAVSLYSVEYGSVAELFLQVIYNEFNFESGKEYCFVRMWCISSGFCTNEIMSFLDASCSSGDVYWWWPWLRLRLGELWKMFTEFTWLYPWLDRLPILSILLLHPYGSTQLSYPVFFFLSTVWGT
jgi:hypothetical protein